MQIIGSFFTFWKDFKVVFGRPDCSVNITACFFYDLLICNRKNGTPAIDTVCQDILVQD